MLIISNGVPGVLQLEGEETSFGFNDHLTLLRALLVQCDSCLLVSPFLYADFAPVLAGLHLKGLAVELVTSCAPRGEDQFVKPFSLKNFGETFQTATGQWPQIGINQSLHSKLYVFSKKGFPFAGIVTSANLTYSGMTQNHETGVALTQQDALQQIESIARRQLDYVSLTPYQIDMLCSAASVFKERHPPQDDVNVGLANILNNYATPAAANRSVRLNPNARYYIKVSGVRDRPILPEHREPFDEPRAQLSFNKSPDKIRIGDCLLEVAVGGGCFLPYYACASPPFERTPIERAENPDHKRWPYYVFANNLALHYGTAWFKAPIYFDQIIGPFKAAFPDIDVTANGNDHILGAMQMGNSYFQVTREFGEFARKAIDAFVDPQP